jgi:multiple antibiotic resistance protein
MSLAMNIIDIALIVQLFILINPLSSFPVLLAAYQNKMNVKRIAISAVFIAFVIAIIVLIIGPYLFSLFRITVDSFRIAGGIVLFLLGLDKVRPKEQKKKDVKQADALTSIIATPLLTGPAIISFVIVQAIDVGKIPLFFNLLFAFIAVGIVFVIFAFTISKINAKIIDIISRILGLFLTAVAIQMIAKGIMGIMAGTG